MNCTVPLDKLKITKSGVSRDAIKALKSHPLFLIDGEIESLGKIRTTRYRPTNNP